MRVAVEMSHDAANVSRFAQTAAIHTTVVNAGFTRRCTGDGAEVAFGVAFG